MELLKQIWQSKNGLDIETKKYVVHTFKNVWDNPDSADIRWIINDWKETEAGRWIESNSKDHLSIYSFYSYKDLQTHYQIIANLTNEQITYFELKFK